MDKSTFRTRIYWSLGNKQEQTVKLYKVEDLISIEVSIFQVGANGFIPAYVDSRIDLDLCVLTVSLRTRLKAERLIKYLNRADYRLREGLKSSLFTLEEREEFTELPAARM